MHLHLPRIPQHPSWCCALTALALCCAPAMADPIQILFVGNSYTFGRVDPVMRYNAANVHDLTAGANAVSNTGTNRWEPHPWGGVPGIFKQFTREKGLDYDVSLSTRNGASLRGHFLNTDNTAWDLRGNVASKQWDVIVLQEQSDASLPPGSGKHANPAQFRAYADKLEQFIHTGAAHTYTETAMYGSLAACLATGASSATCDTSRTIQANPNANAHAKVYLTDTWARPDMVFAHLATVADKNTSDGRPIPSRRNTQATLYYPTLAAMTKDLYDSIDGEAARNGHFAGVIGVGDAFQLALDQQVVKTSGFYDASGVYTAVQPDAPMNLWWEDYLHASKYGSYLDALVQFGTITGLDPRSLGAGEIAASELGISPTDAVTLQRIAALELDLPEPTSIATLALGLGGIGISRRRRPRAGSHTAA